MRPETLPPVGTRVGLDLNPIDVCDPDAALWLRAMIWPDEVGRAELLQQAIQIARQDPPRLLAGDALGLLPELLRTMPADQTLCVFHTHTMNQFPDELIALLDHLPCVGHRISMNPRSHAMLLICR